MMEDQQFQRLLQELLANHRELVAKLEEVRCGIVDVENETEKVKDRISLLEYGHDADYD